jgi:hypothetical protein
MLNTLGIQNEAARAVEEGRDLAGRGAGAVANLNSGSLANQNYMASTGAGEGRFNGRLQQAGQAAGARAQTGVQSNLASKLAEIAMAEQQANAQAASQSSSSSGGMEMNDLVGLAQWMIENEQGQQRNAMQDGMKMNSSPQEKIAILQQLMQNPDLQGNTDMLKLFASVL